MTEDPLASWHSISVELEASPYSITIGHGILSHVGKLIHSQGIIQGDDTVAIITDDEVGPLYAAALEEGLEQAQITSHTFTIPSGESNKSLIQYTALQSQLAQKKIKRSGLILALGGGVVGDLSGFVASTYLRGIKYAQLPTSLLAMVDSSVGGKTGVNLPEGKNLVGSFYQPVAVWADLDTLKSLPEREFAAGLGEVVKYGAIQSRTLVNRLLSGVRIEDEDLAEIISRCVKVKANIVEEDERETSGRRVLLNFGHTLGHAIEQATNYEVYKHGEAISLGMRAAGWLSARLAGLPEFDHQCLQDALRANHLPTHIEDESIKQEKILAALGNDKKVAGDGENRWVLLSELGKAEGGYKVNSELVEEVLEILYNPL